MGEKDNVMMGVCNVSFNSSDLGYTSGGVSVDYSAETVEKKVDQEDAPIDELVTSQAMEVTVPMAERDLSRLGDLLPGATYVVDENDATAVKLVLTGAAGTTLASLAAPLILTPQGSTDENDKLTLYHAVPTPKVSFAYEKDNIRVYEVTFKALVGDDGWVVFGDLAVMEVLSCLPATGAETTALDIVITGSGFTDDSAAVTMGGSACTSVVVIDAQTISCTTAADVSAGTEDIVVTIAGYEATGTGVIVLS